MNGSSLREGARLIAVELGPEKRAYLIEQAAEARSRGAMLEPAHRSIPLFDASMILLQVVIQVAQFIGVAQFIAVCRRSKCTVLTVKSLTACKTPRPWRLTHAIMAGRSLS
jgi:hypothetical protein